MATQSLDSNASGAESSAQPIRNAILRYANPNRALPSGLTAQMSMRAQSNGYAPSLRSNMPVRQQVRASKGRGLGFLGDDSSSDWAYFDGDITSSSSSDSSSMFSGSNLLIVAVALFAATELF